MRRIVVIADGKPGVSCAIRLKHALPDCELNLVTTALSATQDSIKVQPASASTSEAPDVEFLRCRDISVLEAHNVMPDLFQRELILSSNRGSLPVRYTDLVVEVPATARLPHALKSASNLFSWPELTGNAHSKALQAAFLAAKEAKQAILVTGNGLAALEAVLFVREAGLKVQWLRTGEKNVPNIEPQILALLLKHLARDVTCIHLPQFTPEQLICRMDKAQSRLENITWPGGDSLEVSSCLWTFPLMARHPLLREDGVTLDASGRIEAGEEIAGLGLHFIGSGAAVPAARLAEGTVLVPAYPGGEEAANLSVTLAVAKILDTEKKRRAPFKGALRAHRLSSRDLALYCGGVTLLEAQNLGLDAEPALVSASLINGRTEASRLILAVIGDKKSRTLLGVQILCMGAAGAEVEGLAGMALTALEDSSNMESLMQREWSGLPARMLGNAAHILVDKYDTLIQGINPDEFIASRNAGADFFTLDLRSHSEWLEGHVPGAYNIPLLQLNKRLQDEVPRFTPLVLVCATGDDAHATAVRLAALGATDLYVLEGGMNLWPYSLATPEKL
jgi:rhodanese-related sulfurtransferase